MLLPILNEESVCLDELFSKEIQLIHWRTMLTFLDLSIMLLASAQFNWEALKGTKAR